MSVSALASASHDADNLLTLWGATILGYDSNGNLQNDGVNSYSSDARDRLTADIAPDLHPVAA